MRFRTVLPCLVAAALCLTSRVSAQQPVPPAASLPPRFESWEPPRSVFRASWTPTSPATQPRQRTRRALIGGAIGAAVGVVGCTAISTLANDSADGGLSFCPLDSYLLIGGAGFLVGAVIGWVT